MKKRELTKKEFNHFFNMENLLDDNRKNSIKEAMKEHKNEKCLECGLVFFADIHFIKCNNEKCPMKSEDKETLLDKLFR